MRMSFPENNIITFLIGVLNQHAASERSVKRTMGNIVRVPCRMQLRFVYSLSVVWDTGMSSILM